MTRRAWANLSWGAGYLAMLAALSVGFWIARQRVIDDLSRPESLEQWRDWKADAAKQAGPDAAGPVRRKPIRGDEPPTLVLMRDHYRAIWGVALLVSSFLFAFMMFIVRGVMRNAAAGAPAPFAGNGPHDDAGHSSRTNN